MSRQPSRLRSYRRGLAAVSFNGYTYLLLLLFWLPMAVISVEHNAGDRTSVGLMLELAWLAALIASMVIATGDDTREGIGRWFRDK